MLKDRSIIVTFFITFILVFLLISSVYSENFRPGQLILNFKKDYLPLNIVIRNDSVITNLRSLDSLNVVFQCYALDKIYRGNWSVLQGFYLLKFPDSISVPQAVAAYSRDEYILPASKNQTGYYDVEPNDYHYSNQWGLPKIKAEGAWNLEKGDSSTIILILDSCLDWYHPDLGDSILPRIWQNLGEDADLDGHVLEWDPTDSNYVFDPGDRDFRDNEGNGFVDDFVGWDYYEYDHDPYCLPLILLAGDHGNQVGGKAAAATNNSEGVAGAIWYARLMTWRMVVDVSQAYAGIGYGIDNGARVINMSFHFNEPDTNLEEIVNSAWTEGLVLVATPGNDGVEMLAYPAYYENVIAVTATDSFDVKAHYANYGTYIDICAPGYTYSTDRVGREFGYKSKEGTSFAAPLVSGIAALIWSACPDFTNAQVRALLESTADTSIYQKPGNGPYINKLGRGRLDAWNALVTINSGDVQNDKYINDGDVIYLINYLFKGGPPPAQGKGDCNGDGNVTLSDIVYLTNYLYRGGSPPAFCCSACFP